MSRAFTTLVWGGLATVIAVPIAAAAASPLIAWRNPVYIAGGFAGVIAMGLLLLQPLLAGGYLPGISTLRRRRIHRWIGALLVAGIAIHVAALWITSPPDMVDALLFASPTPFSAWGVVAMWAVFAAALLAALRRRLRLRWRTWRFGHSVFATVAVVGSAVHALLIEGTMETFSKTVLCVLVIAATIKAMADLQVWVIRTKGGT